MEVLAVSDLVWSSANVRFQEKRKQYSATSTDSHAFLKRCSLNSGAAAIGSTAPFRRSREAQELLKDEDSVIGRINLL